MSLRLLFELRDLWIGVYWTMFDSSNALFGKPFTRTVRVYVCLVPMLPLRFTFERRMPADQKWAEKEGR